jgi:hypothetical protein
MEQKFIKYLYSYIFPPHGVIVRLGLGAYYNKYTYSIVEVRPHFLQIFFVMKTNMIHYLSSIYFFSQPLNVSGMFIAYHQEVRGTCYKRVTLPSCCIYTVNTS